MFEWTGAAIFLLRRLLEFERVAPWPSVAKRLLEAAIEQPSVEAFDKRILARLVQV